MCLHVAQIFVRDFRFGTGNFRECTYIPHSATSVGLSIFVTSMIVRTCHSATSVGLTIFVQEISVMVHMYYSATSVGLSVFVQEIFVNAMHVASV